jgi:RNA polymerase sigma-70 factor (ECF subfamily)
MMLVGSEIDPELLEACRLGHRDAFHVLFELYKDKVFSIALRYTGEHAAAMDITQDVFVKLFSEIGRFRGESSFNTWLYRMVVNRCLDSKRSLRRLVPLMERTMARFQVGEKVTADLIRSENRRSLETAIAGLAPEMRMAVVLRYTEGLSYEEMAEALGCSRGTVASRLNRAHKQLARRLAHLGEMEFFDV